MRAFDVRLFLRLLLIQIDWNKPSHAASRYYGSAEPFVVVRSNQPKSSRSRECVRGRFVLSIQFGQDTLEFAVRLEEIQPWVFRSQYRIGKSAVGQKVLRC